MRTFKFELRLDFKAVVPESFTKDMRSVARDPEVTSAFLKQCDTEHPDDDEAFTLAVLKNGIRKHVRQNLMEHLHKSGIGGSFAPASITPIDISHEFDVVPVLAKQIDAVLDTGIVD